MTGWLSDEDLAQYSVITLFRAYREKEQMSQELKRLREELVEFYNITKLNETLTHRLNELKQENYELQHANPTLTGPVAALQEQIKKRDGHIAILQRQIMMQKKDINRLITRNKELKDFIKTRITQLAGILQSK